MIHALADKTTQQPMPATVLSTPTVDRVAAMVAALPGTASLPGIAGIDDVLDEIDEVEGLDFDETFEEIQSRASGLPRHADRLRSHLN
jgi:hypothetical protein